METRRLNPRVIKQFNAVNLVFIFSFEILEMESGCCLVSVKVSVRLIGVFQHVNSRPKVNPGWFCPSNNNVVSFFF